MLKRDFSRSNKEYFNKNKYVLIGLLVFALVGILVMSFLGFNGNFEFAGYYEIEVNIGSGSSSTYANEIAGIIDSYGGDFEEYQITSQGGDTILMVRYLDSLSNETQLEINQKIEALSTDNLTITVVNYDGTGTGHNHVGASVTAKDYIYTSLSILLLLIFATIFCYARYNGASAISVLISSLLATFVMLCLTSILRLTIGQSYFAMLVILNLLVVYFSINLFENIRQTNWLATSNYSQAIEEGVKASKFKLCVASIAIFVIGLLFAFIAPSGLKYISLSILFLTVTLLATMLYVVPFVWSVFITKHKKVNSEVKSNPEPTESKTKTKSKTKN